MKLSILHWAARLVAAGILVMGALPKFTGGAGALAEKLPGGMASVYPIGVAELVAVVLLLIPRTSIAGAGLATVLMFGAVASHLVGPVGMEGDMAAMLPMAVIALAAAGTALFLSIKQLKSGGGAKPTSQGEAG